LHQLKFFQIAFTEIPDDLDVARVILERHMALFQDGLNERHFDMVAGHFIATLQKFKVGQDLIDESVGVIAPLRGIFEQASKDHGPPEAAELSDCDDELTSLESSDDSLESTQTLTEKIGGLDTLEGVVDTMFRRVVSDGYINAFLEGMNVETFKIHQLLFLSEALDGKQREGADDDAKVGLDDRFDIVVGRHLQKKLFRQGLNEKHFDRLVEHLVFSLKTFKVARPVIDEVVNVMSPVREVFARGTWQSERLKL
jgi:hemoglobin